MPEILFLLLPAAALYGYVMGRNSLRQSQLKQHEQINQDFLSGLNLFLNNQRDKAIEVLIENLEVNNETFTTHVALGKLFRIKGENDRAIKIHQFLAKQDSLTPSQRRMSILQLATDYVECALFDRAERLLKQLIDDQEFQYEARVMLSRIYQTYRDWQLAFDAIEKLESKENDNLDKIRAYLLCELAVKQSGDERLELLTNALEYDNACARAYLELIDDAISSKDNQQAKHYSYHLVQHCFDFISLLMPKLDKVFTDSTEYLSFLVEANKQGHSTALVNKIAEIRLANKEQGNARKTMISMLEKHATIRGFANLMAINSKQIETEHARLMMQSLQTMVVNKIEQLPDYECDQCGYQGSYLFWQCPRCKNWGSVKPIKGLTGD